MHYSAVTSAFMLAVVATTVPAVTASAGTPPARVTCNSVIAQDAYLTADLRCRDGGGVTLLEGVTLDLRGHALIGPAAEPHGVDSGYGVTLASTGWSAVVNGTVDGFSAGVSDDPSSAEPTTGLVRDVTFQRNGTAVHLSHSLIRAQRLVVSGNATGVVVRERAAITITDSTLRGSRRVGAAAVDLGRLVLRRSVIAGNAVGIQCHETATCDVVGSVFSGNDTGFHIGDDAGAYSALLAGNRFAGNGDAVRIEMPGARLRDNVAVRNSGWGIHAPGALDLGGNRARGNGNEPQCVGVVCR